MFEAVMEHGGTTDYCFINTGKDYFVYLIQKKFISLKNLVSGVRRPLLEARRGSRQHRVCWHRNQARYRNQGDPRQLFLANPGRLL